MRNIFLLLTAIALASCFKQMAFHPVGDMVAPASQHRDVLLPDGTVLITGGQSGEGGIAAAQLYNPATKQFSALPSMTEPRFVHAANLLPDGRVLITGGFNEAGQFLQTSEFFNGESFVRGRDLLEHRDNQRSVALNDGRIFIEGGDNERAGYIASTELFDPASGSFTAGPLLPTGRAMDTITLLRDGTVLMAGGLKVTNFQLRFLAETALFNPVALAMTTGPDLNTPRKQHRATLLDDGHVLITGGMDESGELESAELYDGDKFVTISDMAVARREHCTARLPDGKILIAGGYRDGASLSSTELFDPVSRTFTQGPNMLVARVFHTCTVLQDGSVLVAGGTGDYGVLRSAEILTP